MNNPRFVWLIGSIAEEYPDVPVLPVSSAGTVLWDRQESKAVMTVEPEYSQVMVLERSTSARLMPFTVLERWLNGLSNRALTSENMTPTRAPFTKGNR